MKTKSIIIILATLIIGFFIGFLTNGQITRYKLNRFVSQGSYDAFKFRMMDVIRPDMDQIKDIEPILDKYAQKAHETLEISKENMKELHENLLEDLKPYLNEEQIERLDRTQNRYKRVWERRRGKGPPPHRMKRSGQGR